MNKREKTDLANELTVALGRVAGDFLDAKGARSATDACDVLVNAITQILAGYLSANKRLSDDMIEAYGEMIAASVIEYALDVRRSKSKAQSTPTAKQ
jgi:hypothetical protein